jgi:hypothetical protein
MARKPIGAAKKISEKALEFLRDHPRLAMEQV